MVDFYAEWCPPCKYIAPILDEMQNEFSEIEIAKVDVDNADMKSVKDKHKVNCMPTFIFFKGGKPIHRIEGADKDGIRKFIENPTAEPISEGKCCTIL